MQKSEVLTLVAQNLRRLMNEKEMSITQLSHRCKISTGTVSKILRGNMSITIPMAMTICKGLDTELFDLMDGLSDKKTHHNLKDNTSKNETLFIGILSINNKRITCVKNHESKLIGRSVLEGGLDLASTSSNLLQLILESIKCAMNKENEHTKLKNINLNLVMQSYEFEDTRQKFYNFIEKKFNRVLLLPDSQITYLSVFNDKPGISIIADKGVSIIYKHNNKLKKFGGWKFPVYDLGGENWLGLETIRHTIEATEGYIPKSQLAQNILAKFGGRIGRMTEACFKKGKDPDIFSSFVDPLLRAYCANEPIAKSLIQQGFKQISRTIERIDFITNNQFDITISGSLADIYSPMINKERLTAPMCDLDKATFLASTDKNNLLSQTVQSY